MCILMNTLLSETKHSIQGFTTDSLAAQAPTPSSRRLSHLQESSSGCFFFFCTTKSFTMHLFPTQEFLPTFIDGCIYLQFAPRYLILPFSVSRVHQYCVITRVEPFKKICQQKYLSVSCQDVRHV